MTADQALKCDAATRRDQGVRATAEQGLVSPATPVAGLLDVTGVRASAASRSMRSPHPALPVLHAFAVKATPLAPVRRLLHGEGIRAEVASPGEPALARAAGRAPARTVIDSPAKTPAELREALALGIPVNADNPQELARLDALVRRATRSPAGPSPRTWRAPPASPATSSPRTTTCPGSNRATTPPRSTPARTPSPSNTRTARGLAAVSSHSLGPRRARGCAPFAVRPSRPRSRCRRRRAR